jgi:hypothetical protein
VGTDVQDFVTRFAAAWAARDGNAFLELWHGDGTLTTPLVDTAPLRAFRSGEKLEPITRL